MSNLILPPDAHRMEELKTEFLGLNLTGSDTARGYNQEADIITRTSDGADLNGMWREFQKTINVWNGQRNPYMSMFTYRVTQDIESVRYPLEQDFEEASEYGEPRSIRLGPAFRMGYDFKWYDLAIRYTWKFLLDASSDQLRALNNQALESDNRLQFTRILRRIFNSTTDVATIEGDAINVYPFYNGDTMVPPKWKTTTHTTGHNHYLTSGAAAVDQVDLQDMYTQLSHHGYTQANGYTALLMVNPAQGATIRTFSVGDTVGGVYDFMPGPAYGGGVYLPANGGVVALPDRAPTGGFDVIGTYGPWTIVEDDYIPVGYMLGLASGGPNNLGNPVGIREHPSLKGLRLVKGRDNDYPLTDSFYLHGMGTGIRQRGGGVVMQVTASGSYTIPTQYA
jgi:hypothetical protein